MQSAVEAFLSKLTHQPCLLLVHSEIERLEDAADGLLSAYDWPRLSVGRELSDVLLSEMPQRRSHTARQWISTRLGGLSPGPVLCTEIDLLFEPALELDPLSLMRDVGRVTRVVVTWPGSYQDGVLSYATPEHSRYRAWRRPKVPIVVL